MRERCQQIERSAALWTSHLRAIFLEEAYQFMFRRGMKAELDGFRAGREVWEPQIVPVV
jgi:hypothetical protein